MSLRLSAPAYLSFFRSGPSEWRKGDLEPDLHRRFASDKGRLGVMSTFSSEDEVDDGGLFASDEDARREDRERGVYAMATAAGAVTASPPVTAPSDCESDDCAKEAG